MFRITVYLILFSLMSWTTPKKSTAAEPAQDKKILVVISGANEMLLASPPGNSISTGYFLVELAQVLQVFERQGYSFDFAIPKTKELQYPTLDINGFDLAFYHGDARRHHIVALTKNTARARQKRMAEVRTAWKYFGKLHFSKPLVNSDPEAVAFAKEIDRIQKSNGYQAKEFLSLKDLHETREQLPQKYAAIYIPGGHAPMVDLGNNPFLGDILVEFDRAGSLIAAVCHGPYALRSASFTYEPRNKDGRKRRLGGNPFAGRWATTVSTREERLMMSINYPRQRVETPESRQRQRASQRARRLYPLLPPPWPSYYPTRAPFYVDQRLEAEGIRLNLNNKWRQLGAVIVERDRNLITGNGPQAMDALVQEMQIWLEH